MIGDCRALDAPPCDSLAEAVVLTRLMQHPDWISRYDVGRLLCFPEHRWIWQGMQRVRRAGTTDFFARWLRDAQEHHPEHWLNLVDVLYPPDEVARGWEEYEAGDDPRRSSYDHPFEWWLKRLQRIAEARQLIRDAQRVAEHAWREDVDGARVVAAGMRGREVVRVEV